MTFLYQQLSGLRGLIELSNSAMDVYMRPYGDVTSATHNFVDQSIGILDTHGIIVMGNEFRSMKTELVAAGNGVDLTNLRPVDSFRRTRAKIVALSILLRACDSLRVKLAETERELESGRESLGRIAIVAIESGSLALPRPGDNLSERLQMEWLLLKENPRTRQAALGVSLRFSEADCLILLAEALWSLAPNNRE